MCEFKLDEFELYKNYVIEASAGTGKTYNIIEIVGKLISNNIPLNKILIVTYTEKATSELRNRINNKLISLKSSESINNAEIYTIHSFCKTIMEEFPISGNFNSNMTMIDDSKLDEFAEVYIRKNSKCLEYIQNDEINPDDLKEKLVNFTKRYYLDKDFNENTDVVSHVLTSISEEDINNYLFLKNAKTVDDLSKNKNFSDIKRCYDEVTDRLNNLAKGKRALTNIKSRIDRFNKGFSTTAAEGHPDFNDCWNRLNELNKKFNEIDKIDVVTNYALLKEFYIDWINYKQEFKLIDFSDMIRSVHEEVLNNEEFLNKLKDKYQYVIIDEFQDTNQLQYDIFKSIFLSDNHNMIVVGDPKQSIFSFQGTDLTVYNKAKEEIEKNSGLIKSLSKNYRTTGSLVSGVNELISFFKDSNSRFNSFNDFKGSSSINFKDNGKEFNVYFENQELKEPIWIAYDKDKEGKIQFIDEDKYSDIVASKIVELCTLDKSSKTTKLQVEETNKEGSFKRNVSFKDFCILCRTRTELDKIIYKLKKNGIPYLQYKDSNLFKGRECAHFKAILEALIVNDFTGSNRKIYNKALFTDFFGCDLKTINSSYSLRDDTDEMKKLNEWRKIASKYDWAELIESLLYDSKLRKNNSKSEKMQSLFNYIQIGQYVLDSLTKGYNLSDVLKKLNDLSNSISSEDDEDNTSVVERASDFDCVKIMTMHSSKGLEFPIVISAGGLKDLLNNDKNKAFIHHENDKAVITLGRFSNEEEVEEIKRLFYVAYTRSKYLLITPLYKNVLKPTKKNPEGKPIVLHFISDTLIKLIENNSQYVKQISSSVSKDLKKQVSEILANNNTVNNSNNDENKEKRDKLIETKSSQLTHKHSYSSLTHFNNSINKTKDNADNDLEQNGEAEDLGFKDKEGIIDPNIELGIYDSKFKEIKPKYNKELNPIELSSNFPRGNRIGTILHEVFEKADFKDLSNIVELIKECFKHEGLTLKNEWIKDVKDIVSSVLNAKLEEINGSNDTNNSFKLNELSLEDRLSEIEFNFNFKDNTIKDYCNGFIDLIFKRGEYYSILDWKSDSLNEEEGFISYSDYSNLKDHTSKHYAIQRVLYSYTLVKYLNNAYKDKTLEETFNNHFGGIYYVYLKGCNNDSFNGIYSQTWNSFAELEDAYNNIVKIKVDKENVNG